jgi:Fe-S oxidoreductase
MSDAIRKPEELSDVDYDLPSTGWMDTKTEIKEGNFCYAAKPASLAKLGMPSPRDWRTKEDGDWRPQDEDWKLPKGWKETIHDGMKDRLSRFRSFQLFMDICVRCGACADKCHFFIGGGDPKNMPVLRAELMRSIYRHDHTSLGKVLGKLTGGRPLTEEVIKEWFIYFYQCTECRRCSVFCPYGIDTAEITMMGRELLNLVGLNTDWIHTPIANCYRVGNHLGIEPHTFKDTLEFFAEEIEGVCGVAPYLPINKKGADVLFVTPSGDYFADPGTYTLMGYLMLFHYLHEKYGFNYTWSTYASEGGNFGLFSSNETMKRLNRKIYAEAERLRIKKFILGGECGHMWRVLHQYMDTLNGPAPSNLIDVPTSSITNTTFDNARSTKMVHITEFTADLIKHDKLELDPSRNDKFRVTFHDSCNPARGMGLFEEPRYVLRNVCNNFWDMPPNTIREQTFCCGAGSGLNTDEILELRMQGGFPRANAVKHVRDLHGVNTLACICAIDRATLSALMEYWSPDVGVCGIHELVGNALIMPGESERTTDLRGNDLQPEQEEDE